MTPSRTTTPATGLPVIAGAGVRAPVVDTATGSDSDIFGFTPTKDHVAIGFAEMSAEYRHPTARDMLAKGLRTVVDAERFFHARFYRAGALAYHADHPSRATSALADGYRKYPRVELLLRYAAEGDRFAKTKIDEIIYHYHLRHFPIKRHVDVLAMIGFSGHVKAMEKLFRYLATQAADRAVRRDIIDRVFSASELELRGDYRYVLKVLKGYLPDAEMFASAPVGVQEFIANYDVMPLIQLAASGRGTAIEILQYLKDVGRADIDEILAESASKA